MAGMPQLGVAIIIAIIVNGAFSFAQEYRAERAVRELSSPLGAAQATRRSSLGRAD
jgi:hypothetical protein